MKHRIYAISKKWLERDRLFSLYGPPRNNAGTTAVDANGIGYLMIDGPLLKGAGNFWGGMSDPSILRQQLRALEADPNVKAIVMRVYSPGGTVDGINDLAQDVARVDRKKPVYGYAEDAALSAGYWALSNARFIAANETAEVGSIGVYAVIYDESKAAEQFGIVAHVVSSGDKKGQGVHGLPISEEYLGDLQARVDEFAGFFVESVSKGRKLRRAKVEALATGEDWIAAKAKENGLIDEVMGWDDFITRVVNDIRKAARGRLTATGLRIAAIKHGVNANV